MEVLLFANLSDYEPSALNTAPLRLLEPVFKTNEVRSSYVKQSKLGVKWRFLFCSKPCVGSPTSTTCVRSHDHICSSFTDPGI